MNSMNNFASIFCSSSSIPLWCDAPLLLRLPGKCTPVLVFIICNKKIINVLLKFKPHWGALSLSLSFANCIHKLFVCVSVPPVEISASHRKHFRFVCFFCCCCLLFVCSGNNHRISDTLTLMLWIHSYSEQKMTKRSERATEWSVRRL